MPDRNHRKGLVLTVRDADGNILLGIQNIFQKAVTDRDGFAIAEVDNDGISFNSGSLRDQLLVFFIFLLIQLHPFLKIGKF